MNRTAIIIIVIVVLAVGGVLFYLNYRSKKESGSAGSTGGSSGGSTGGGELPNGSFPLKKGDKNRLVMELQAILNASFNAGLGVDGDFGPKTEAAAKDAYKKINGSEAPGFLNIGQDLFTKMQNYTPVAGNKLSWRDSSFINGVITAVEGLSRGNNTGKAEINSLPRYGDSMLKTIYNNYQDKYYRSMTKDLGKYRPDAGTADGYKILMAKLSQLNLK